MDREVTEGVRQLSDELRAPNNRICVLFEGRIAAQIVKTGRDGAYYALFDYDGTTVKFYRVCTPDETTQIDGGFNENLYERYQSDHEFRASKVTFITL